MYYEQLRTCENTPISIKLEEKERRVSIMSSKGNFKCTRCKRIIKGRPALSRKDNKSKVCSACGFIEAKEIYEKNMYERRNTNA